MIDFHNHILPNVDDGPKTIEESLEMIRFAHKQGITNIINTVHFQHPKMDGKNVDFEYLNKKVKELQLLIDAEKLNIKIHLSAEVFYLPNLTEIVKNPLVTIGNKKYMLIEFTNNIYPNGFEEEFYKLQLMGITPIVAHPERYRFVQNDIEVLDAWINRGYIIQIDGGSILGLFGKQTEKIVNKILLNGSFHLIGSDAHNNKKRNFCLKLAYEKISKLTSAKVTHQLKSNTKYLLNGKKITCVKHIFLSKDLNKNKTSNWIEKLSKFAKL